MRMKNGFLTLLIMMLALPAVMPAFSHGSIHGFHNHDEAHHGSFKTDVDSHGIEQSFEHPVHFDITTYYSDYLHVDLNVPHPSMLQAPTLDIQDIDFAITGDIKSLDHYKLASLQAPRAPPDWQRPLSGNTPLYLFTRRLRI